MRARLHRAGLRFRSHYRPLTHGRGEGDIAFAGKRIIVQIDGCFWHGCPIHGSHPVHNQEWWAAKLQSNIERDRRLSKEFTAAGWTVMRFWEHQDVDEIVATILLAVKAAPNVAPSSRHRRLDHQT